MKTLIKNGRIITAVGKKILTKTLGLWLITIFSALGFAQGDRFAEKHLLILRNVTVISMRGEQPQRKMTVVVSGSRIAKIGKNISIPKNADVIDASGKYLIPGLWDMHVHLFNNISRAGTDNKEAYFPLWIANGVTGVRDMASDAEDIKLAQKWNREIADGTTIGPHVYVSSQIVDGVPTFLPHF